MWDGVFSVMGELLAGAGNLIGMAAVVGVALRFYFLFDRKAGERIAKAEAKAATAELAERAADTRADIERNARLLAQNEAATERAEKIALRGEIEALRQEVARLRLQIEHLTGTHVAVTPSVTTIVTASRTTTTEETQ